MSVAIYNLDGEEIDKIQLPKIFSAPYNPKLIHRAAVAIESHMFVPNGTDPLAGERGSTQSYNTGCTNLLKPFKACSGGGGGNIGKAHV